MLTDDSLESEVNLKGGKEEEKIYMADAGRQIG